MNFEKIKDKLPLAGFIILIFIGMAYFMIQYADERVKKNLLAELAPIDALCKGTSGCPAIPDGWNERKCPDFQDLPEVKICASPRSDSPYRTLIYKASSKQFTIWWSYVAGSYVRVRGGAGQPMQMEEIAIQKYSQVL